VNPDQVALGPLPAGIALPLAETGAILAPFVLTPVEQAKHGRLQHGYDRAISLEDDREAHAREPPMSTGLGLAPGSLDPTRA
jgi:hypothetical protein